MKAQICKSLFLLRKLRKKNKKQIEIITKKTEEILLNPHRYKNLRTPLNNWKRVHIDKNFVLLFSVDEDNKIVVLEDFDHHNNKIRWNCLSAT
ncbi:MAG: type II toxin-antitoxin system RelE/ParE family toxin [Nanoarchaeota archaeon]|nr:type II toxin-antitoxin system RelE/ParE family toxin [Nanoarchaeota archaeon]MBU1855034.1 type II toxin-antitoxin system RelE/ParE family toxin [Nanoarchaeota archaeon]